MSSVSVFVGSVLPAMFAQKVSRKKIETRKGKTIECSVISSYLHYFPKELEVEKFFVPQIPYVRVLKGGHWRNRRF